MAYRKEGFNINELINELSGTCKSLDEVLERMTEGEMEYEDLTDEDFSDIDRAIFECDGCGWWCEAGELQEGEYGEQLCSQCF